MDERSDGVTRRRFVAGAGAAAFSFLAMEPRTALGTAASGKLRLGMIGCGHRGTRVAEFFRKHGGFDVVAGADYFRDRADAFGAANGLPENRRFTTLSCYKRLLDAGVEAVAVESPPYFHAEQAAAAVEAGAHVYLAKPIAVDVPGVRLVAEGGRKATSRKLVYLVDFQTRADRFFQEAMRRVRAGAIGTFAFGESTYHAGCPWNDQIAAIRDDPKDPEKRLRAWGLDRVLSGDIITEQNIHTLDVMNWIMDADPLHAAGTCGRKVREDRGDCNDHFAVLYQYPNGVGITFSSRQFEGYGTSEGIKNRMFGSKGVLETTYAGEVIIRGADPYPGGSSPNLYNQGIVDNIATFYEHIANGDASNPTVAPSVRSNLITILGRMAAYSGERVTWRQLLASDEKLSFDTKGLKA
ncbi:MAG: Gfo/Idh/MocA family oxidoreductase [Planctomycetes bacterium]|nr:Gfo/Idh/MocA family oxidoreductase [Planctomycetota bacterium]